MRAHGLRPYALALILTAALSAPAVAATVSVYPTSAIVTVGADRRLTVYVNGRPITAVTWTVNGVVGGAAATGFIDASGKYTAPASAAAGCSAR